jgi:hypothetical protein
MAAPGMLNSGDTNAKTTGESLSSLRRSANSDNGLSRQNGIASAVAAHVPTLRHLIGFIVLKRAEKKMCRIAAPGHVAAVTDEKPIRNRAAKKRIRQTMHLHLRYGP